MATLTDEQLALIQADLDQLAQYYTVGPEGSGVTTMHGVETQLAELGDNPGVIFWMRVKHVDQESGGLELEITKLAVQ